MNIDLIETAGKSQYRLVRVPPYFFFPKKERKREIPKVNYVNRTDCLAAYLFLTEAGAKYIT